MLKLPFNNMQSMPLGQFYGMLLSMLSITHTALNEKINVQNISLYTC